MSSGNSTFEGLEPTVIIGRAEVLRRTGLKKSTMYKLIDQGKFKSTDTSTPELFEACRVRRGVPAGVLDVAGSAVILNEPRIIRALIGQGEAASVAQHVRITDRLQRGYAFHILIDAAASPVPILPQKPQKYRDRKPVGSFSRRPMQDGYTFLPRLKSISARPRRDSSRRAGDRRAG